MGRAPTAAVPSLQLPVVVLLTAGAFVWGHLAGSAQPARPAPAGPLAPHAARKTLEAQPPRHALGQPQPQQAPGQGQQRGAGQGQPQQLREMGALGEEFLAASGLAALRPPLPAAESGNGFYTVQPFQVLSWYPRIVVYPNFIDAPRADHVVAMARSKLRRSGLAWRPDEAPDDNQDTRTSSGTFLDATEDRAGVLAWLEEKIAAVTLLPASHGEAFNILRYDLGAHYDSHMDTFDPKDFGEQDSQRMATVLVYLSDVEEGGETIFKREGRDNGGVEITDYKSCDKGFKYKPRKGDAVLFHSLDPDLKINPRSLHGGCPVIKGEKWVATKWLHEVPFGGRAG
ncbi:MAG: hypothetical protein J3K34DRAFT_458598 [Monoraphidium minutum]|nr:MAG: hypothetical protein J3K34DRAFT_458598 [Monoraphidium minutum]